MDQQGKLSSESNRVLENLQEASRNFVCRNNELFKRSYRSSNDPRTVESIHFMLIESITHETGVRYRRREIRAGSLEEAERLADEQYPPLQHPKHQWRRQIVRVIKNAANHKQS